MRLRRPKDLDDVLESFSNYFNNDFENNYPIRLEIGMGKGDFIIKMAKEFPEINFIGLERYKPAFYIAVKKLEDEQLNNLKFILGDIEDTYEELLEKIDLIYLNFSDPWPKKRHIKRRLTHQSKLNLFDKLFKEDQKIILKTDSDELFDYSLESLTKYGYKINKKIIDLHNTNIFNIKTEYEIKFSSLGKTIKYLEASKPKKVDTNR